METIQAAICVLTRGYENISGYDELIRRNKALLEFLPSGGVIGYDMLIFHEGNISDEQVTHIQQESGALHLKFVSVEQEFRYKPLPETSRYCYETDSSKRFGHGYRCMCRFWFSGFLDYLEGYDYAIRFDEDCICMNFPLPEIIGEMRSKDIHYVTPCLKGADSAGVVVGMKEFAMDFCQDHCIQKAPVFDENPYTNVFVLDVSFFRRHELFRSFSEAVDRTRCIDINRWGDLPLWGVILSILPENGVMNTDHRIRYYHGSHKAYVNDPDAASKNGKEKRKSSSYCYTSFLIQGDHLFS